MMRDSFDVLRNVVRLANCGAADHLACFHGILDYLTRALGLAEASLYFLDARGDRFSRVLRASSPPSSHDCHIPLEETLQGEVLRTRQARTEGAQAVFAVVTRYREHGVLSVELLPGSTLSEGDLSLLEAISEELASLAQLHHDVEAEKEQASALGQMKALSAENDRKFREISLLYRISRAMHSTLRLNELVHLILSAATVKEGGGFERAMLFTVNERSGTLQGMLGVTRRAAQLVLPKTEGLDSWAHPRMGAEVQEAQRRTAFCRQVLKQRLPLDAEDNALARAVADTEVVLIRDSTSLQGSDRAFATALELKAYACAPLLGKDRVLGVVVVDNPDSHEDITPGRLRFLELFANQAAAAMENSMLLHRLESAHQDLRETQERLIQGEKLAVLGEMAASVAHELRNPLVSIGGFAQRLCRHAPEGSRDREYAGIIAREVRRMEEMLTNILAFSKKQMLCFVECDLIRIIDEVVDLENNAILAAGIELKVEVTDNLAKVQGDAQKLRQVLLNMVANARQVMSLGGTLTVRAYPTVLRGESAVAVEVEDTGGGISDEVMRNIFNPFFTTKGEGTGLGLSISHRIVELHRGEIEVMNREKGALFILRIPCREGNEARLR
ncbi:GAF domain-containing sensor histidine kinase [Desulfuromonas sp. AOP6]|uniref:sensor histidine kinase n=1 Tax=Desulfuromonas sp. AOP6 TaxID=1566351 RepID=UPI00126DB19F|nr:GAF domain-containing sensor histidine kinase [Desulfuromonas sp. AOP6]BCA80724.1 sensor histidine kinase [Desulfuromonas sp. AOP6]